MAYPVTVIKNPSDNTRNLLFCLNSERSQLALEQRPLESTQEMIPYHDYGIGKGNIVNSGSLAAVLHWKMVTVYGITQPGTADKAAVRYISKLSPIYNLVPDIAGKPLVTDGKAIAACDDNSGTNYIFYISTDGQDKKKWKIYEATIKYLKAETYRARGTVSPSQGSNLAAVYFPAFEDRFAFYHGSTEDEQCLWSVSAKSGNSNDIPNTGDAKEATPLAANAVEKNDAEGQYLHIYLYYMGPNRSLRRVVGTARGRDIQWAAAQVVPGLALEDNTMLAVSNHGGESARNIIYYVARGQTSFSSYVDEQKPGWFKRPENA